MQKLLRLSDLPELFGNLYILPDFFLCTPTCIFKTYCFLLLNDIFIIEILHASIVDHYSNFNSRIVFPCLNFHFCNQSSNVEVQQNYFRNQQCGPTLCTSSLFTCSDSLGEIPEK